MSARNILLTVVALLTLTSAVFAAPHSAVVVYGDSLSDNGNLYQATGFTQPPDPPYFAGRRSNGPVAVEQLATSLGAPLVDYAWIGATTGIGNYADEGTVTTTGWAGLPGMSAVYAATKGTLTPYLADGLFVVWGGPNDILAPSPLDATPAEIVSRAVFNELAIITDLQARGARTILAPGMPDIGLTPYFQSLGPAIAAYGSYLTDTFNAALLAQLPADVLYYDTAALLRNVVANPAAYGFTNATDYYLHTMAGDPNDYVFFDDFHPTAATHAILAREFEAATVPEPATIVFLGAGGALLLFLKRRQQRQQYPSGIVHRE